MAPALTGGGTSASLLQEHQPSSHQENHRVTQLEPPFCRFLGLLKQSNELGLNRSQQSKTDLQFQGPLCGAMLCLPRGWSGKAAYPVAQTCALQLANRTNTLALLGRLPGCVSVFGTGNGGHHEHFLPKPALGTRLPAGQHLAPSEAVSVTRFLSLPQSQWSLNV